MLDRMELLLARRILEIRVEGQPNELATPVFVSESDASRSSQLRLHAWSLVPRTCSRNKCDELPWFGSLCSDPSEVPALRADVRVRVCRVVWVRVGGCKCRGRSNEHESRVNGHSSRDGREGRDSRGEV